MSKNPSKSFLRCRAIEKLSERPHCCNPLTVAEGSKLRLVLDLRHVNQYVKHHKFCYEDLRTVSELFEEGDYFTTFDLKSGYHHIDINKAHRKYLGFSLTFSDGTIRYFQFCVLPFGLSSACFIFTKVMRTFVKNWRSTGMKCVIYIDDGINGASSSSRAAIENAIILRDLKEAGFVINKDKSNGTPAQTGKWLGMTLDTNKMIFSVPIEKINKLQQQLTVVLKQKTVSQNNRIAFVHAFSDRSTSAFVYSKSLLPN